MVYANGQIPQSALVKIRKKYWADPSRPVWLTKEAAASFYRLAKAYQREARRQGWSQRTLKLASGYRSLEEQQQAWADYQAGIGNLAAPPGTSNHGWALAGDFNTGYMGVSYNGTAPANWLKANAQKFGWMPTGYGFSSVEPWHYDYNLATDVAATTYTRITLTDDRSINMQLVEQKNGDKWLIEPAARIFEKITNKNWNAISRTLSRRARRATISRKVSGSDIKDYRATVIRKWPDAEKIECLAVPIAED